MVNLKNSYLLVLFLGITQWVFSQSGSLSGRIEDDTANAIPFATIQILSTSHIASGDGDGFFRFNNLKAGEYRLMVTSFTIDTTFYNVLVEAGKKTNIVIKAEHSVSEQPTVVITATKTEKELSEIPIPVKVIDKSQIAQMGSARLNEVLAEQTGLAIISDHGTGVQMQGLNSEYTLILLNGEPLIGRTAGTFDLTRLAVGNIKKIEIVKGPASSLYGSEALAGVINIITEEPNQKLSGSIKTRYATNNSLGLTADVNLGVGKSKLNLFADRFSSSGYYLNSEVDKTVPPFQNYTFQASYSYRFSPKFNLAVSGRFFTQNQTSTYSVSEGTSLIRISENGLQRDWNFNPVFTYYISSKDKLTSRTYLSNYHTNSRMERMQDATLFDDSYFNQQFNREELQYDRRWNSKHQTTLGTGYILEAVNSTRYSARKSFYSLYLYAQHDFTMLKILEFIVGGRYDHHSVYGSQLSPKISSSIKLHKAFTLKASVGRGFKAPDFRQLYLNFTNQVEGYSVLGTEEIVTSLAAMNAQGLISQYLINPDGLTPLKAEQSTSFNMGWMASLFKKVTWQVNFFRNDVHNMIATMGIAVKTNNQTVFSYSNLNSVYTQGVETDVAIKIHKDLTLSAGYQYLIAKDKQVLSDIDKGLYFSKDPETWVTRRLTREDYGGLFNRSRHMANMRLFYNHQKSGWAGSIRAIYRGRYGFNDVNGNLILDSEKEYVKGYVVWNVSISKRILKNIVVQGGVDNVSGYTNPLYIPTLPGRIFYGSLTIPLTKETFGTIKK